MVLVITKFTSVMLLWCSINTQSFVHNKSSSTLQLLKGKWRKLQNLLRYLSGIVTSTFKVGTHSCGGCGGRGGWDTSGFGKGCGGRGDRSVFSGVFHVIFVLYSTIYTVKHYHQHHQFCLYNNSTTFQMPFNKCNYILTDGNRHDYIKVFCIVY